MSEPGIPISVHDLMSILFATESPARTEMTLCVRCDGSILLGVTEAHIAQQVNVYWLLEDETAPCVHCVVEGVLVMLAAECWTEEWLQSQYRDRLRGGQPTEVRLTFKADGWHPTFQDAEEPWVYTVGFCRDHCGR